MTSYREHRRAHLLTGRPLPRRFAALDNILAAAGYLIVPAVVVAYVFVRFVVF